MVNLNDYTPLGDDDLLHLGDVVKDVNTGEYRMVTESSSDWLYEGDKIGLLKKNAFNEILRKT